MTANTKIEWADHTFNPWVGCTKVGPGCDHCYAEGWAKRSGLVQWGAGQPRQRTKTWGDPVRWNKQEFVECATCCWRGDFRKFMRRDHTGFEHSMCPRCGGVDYVRTRARVFCASLADVFDNEVPDSWRVDLFRLIGATPHLDWLLLTKRIGNAAPMIYRYFDSINIGRLPNSAFTLGPHVWIGATVVNQEEADRDIPKLLQVPAAKRFLSIEPMLGPISLDDIDCGGVGEDVIPREYWTCVDDDDSHPALALNALEGYYWQRWGDWEERTKRLDLVIAGGESGPHARPAHPDWFRSLRDQCAAAGVPFLFKQWGEWIHELHDDAGKYDPTRLGQHEWPDTFLSIKVGKKNAGRALDGRTHDGFPS